MSESRVSWTVLPGLAAELLTVDSAWPWGSWFSITTPGVPVRTGLYCCSRPEMPPFWPTSPRTWAARSLLGRVAGEGVLDADPADAERLDGVADRLVEAFGDDRVSARDDQLREDRALGHLEQRRELHRGLLGVGDQVRRGDDRVTEPVEGELISVAVDDRPTLTGTDDRLLLLPGGHRREPAGIDRAEPAGPQDHGCDADDRQGTEEPDTPGPVASRQRRRLGGAAAARRWSLALPSGTRPRTTRSRTRASVHRPTASGSARSGTSPGTPPPAASQAAASPRCGPVRRSAGAPG